MGKEVETSKNVTMKFNTFQSVQYDFLVPRDVKTISHIVRVQTNFPEFGIGQPWDAKPIFIHYLELDPGKVGLSGAALETEITQAFERLKRDKTAEIGKSKGQLADLVEDAKCQVISNSKYPQDFVM